MKFYNDFNSMFNAHSLVSEKYIYNKTYEEGFDIPGTGLIGYKIKVLPSDGDNDAALVDTYVTITVKPIKGGTKKIGDVLKEDGGEYGVFVQYDVDGIAGNFVDAISSKLNLSRGLVEGRKYETFEEAKEAAKKLADKIDSYVKDYEK